MMKTRLLLADDHAVVRAGIRNALRDLEDVEVVGEVGDGASLMQALVNLQPQFIMIDVSMPNFNAIATISEIRNLYPDIKILVVSAYDDDVYVQGLLGLGVDGYHLKDQPLSDLQFAVRRILEGKKWISSRIVDKLVTYRNTPAPQQVKLTDRQRDLLRLLHQGMDNGTIAMQLGLSIKTIENHLTRLYKIIDVRSRLEALNYIIQHPEVLGTENIKANLSEFPLNHGHVGGISCLLVDDNTRYRKQLIRTITGILPSLIAYEAANIGEAVSVANRVHPNLALVDVVLGDESGIHCVQRIKRISPHSRIILISAYPDSEFHRRGLEAGAVAFLDKKSLDTATLRQICNDISASMH